MGVKLESMSTYGALKTLSEVKMIAVKMPIDAKVPPRIDRMPNGVYTKGIVAASIIITSSRH